MFQSLKEKYKWVRREWRLLDALIKDVECISKSANEIGNKARQLWDVELSPGLIVRLHQTERAWLETTKKVVGEAEICVKSYQRLSERGEFLIWSYSMFRDWIDIRNLDFDFDRIKDAIDNLIMKREKPLEDLYGSLERSRSIVRSLHDRPIKEDRSFVYTRALSTLSIERILNDPIDTNPSLVLGMQEETESIKLVLELLLAFLRDLEGLRLESETEKAWVDEAEEIIREIQYDIYSVQTLAHPMIWFSYFINLTAKLQRRRCKCMETVLWDLFKRKEMYGFTFIRRDPSKSFGKQMLPPQTFDDVGILALVDNIHNLILEKASTVCASKLRKLSDRFEKVRQLFRDANSFEGVKHSRMASLRTYRLQIINWLTFSTGIERFFCALELLEISLEACRIEPREETNLAVGLEEDVHEVVSRLTTIGQGHSTLCIVGMKGIGKTTLAKIIYNNKTIRQHFEVFAWVSLTDSVAEDSVLKILGQQVLGTDAEWNENEFWIQRVRDFLLVGRYILVLDNIRTKNDWDNLKGAFPETTNGSRIVVTTKYRSVASYTDQSRIPYQLRLRTKDESWCLFTQIVLFQPQLSPEEKATANKVVGRCGGLPLSILHLGFLMLGENVTIVELSRALEHMKHYQTPWLETKKMNDEDLSLHLKRCLSYFAHFPKDSEIPARRLTALWAAEGLAEHSGDEQEPLEHGAERSLSELIDRNLIQVVEQKHNREVKTCGFPTALRELWLQSYGSKITPTWSLSSSLEQRLVCHLDEKDLSCSHTRGTNINSPDVCRRYRNLHSILIFDTQAGYKPGEDIANFFSRGIGSGHLLQLHVLDLEHVFQPQLPNTIGTLIHLIYLGLRWTYLKTIPSSIGKLKNLQTLDLKHTYIRILPGSVWKLQKLQHLYMNEIHRCKIQYKPRCNFLQNLQTLWGAFVDKDSPLKDGLYRLISLRKLKMAIQLNLSQQQELAESLVKMRHLQTLKLKSIDEMGWPQNLELYCLSGLENLSNLYLFGKLETPSIININGLPLNLTELTLSASRLSNDPMPELEKLCQLKLLSFYFDSYTGTSMVCSNGGFPQLQVLRFWMLNVLEEWKVEEQAMPKLKNLEIRSCEKLMVPTGLRHLKTLRELKLKDMALEFNATIEVTKDQIWGDIAHAPAIIIETK